MSITFQVLFLYAFLFCFEGGGLFCLIVLAVKLLSGFKAFFPSVKDFTLGVSVVILDGSSVVQMLKALFSEQCTNDVFIMIGNIHFLYS